MLVARDFLKRWLAVRDKWFALDGTLSMQTKKEHAYVKEMGVFALRRAYIDVIDSLGLRPAEALPIRSGLIAHPR